MIVILGGTGLVGGKFCSYFQEHGIAYHSVGRREVCLYDAERLAGDLKRYRPAFVINCAGFTGRPNVDACETQRAQCLAANAVLPGIIAEACVRLDIPWGHVSSGCIYTGDGPHAKGFDEKDPPNFSFRQNNCSFYSGCKALGEELLATNEQCFIWRLRIPFDEVDYARNYISKLMRYDRLLEARNSLSSLDEFVAACHQCWKDSLPYGIYNLTNTGSVTTREAVDLIRKYGLTDKSFQYFRDETEFMQTAAVAPRSNCVLNNDKALRAGLRLSSVQDALERCMRNWRQAGSSITLPRDSTAA